MPYKLSLWIQWSYCGQMLQDPLISTWFPRIRLNRLINTKSNQSLLSLLYRTLQFLILMFQRWSTCCPRIRYRVSSLTSIISWVWTSPLHLHLRHQWDQSQHYRIWLSLLPHYVLWEYWELLVIVWHLNRGSLIVEQHIMSLMIVICF